MSGVWLIPEAAEIIARKRVATGMAVQANKRLSDLPVAEHGMVGA